MSMHFVLPMAALLVDRLPKGDEWLYEAKFDGYRALALKDGTRVRILSRKGNDLTADYAAIRQSVAALKAKSAVIDGEIVAFDESGRPSFQHLHHRSANRAAIRYFAFDLLHLNGKDLQAESLTVRRAALEKIVTRSDVVFSAELPGSADDVIQAVADVGLEGVVAKRRDSRYESGKRSGAWQKFKLQQVRSSSSAATSLRTPTSNRLSSAITRTRSCGLRPACARASPLHSAARCSSCSTVESREVPVRGSAERKNGSLGRRSDRRGHEGPQMGEAHPGRGDRVHRVDSRRAPASLGVRGTPQDKDARSVVREHPTSR